MLHINFIIKISIAVLLNHLVCISSLENGKIVVRIREAVEASIPTPTNKVMPEPDSFESITPNYAVDPFEVTRLARVEQAMVTALRHEDLQDSILSPFDDEDEEDCPCFLGVAKYLKEFDQDTQAIKLPRRVDGSILEKTSRRAIIVAENPILSLRLIRRVLTFFNETLPSCTKHPDDELVVETVKELFSSEQMFPPLEKDLQEGLEGFLRIHYVYGFNATSELRFGIFKEFRTNATLDHQDCLLLGEKAIEMEAEALAYQWLIAVPLSIPPEELPMPEDTILRLENAWQKLMHLTNVKSLKQLHEKLAGKRQEKWGSLQDFESYAPCRGEMSRAAKERIVYPNKIACFYANHFWDPYFAINPIKLEVLSDDPLIIQFYEFFGDKARWIIQSSIAYIPQRANYVAGKEAETSNHRTSMNTFVLDTIDFNPHPLLMNLNRRTEKLIKMHVVRNASSQMQVAVYSALGGHYDFHHDAYVKSTPKKFMDAHEGNRIATILFFLTTVKMGGHTAFVDAGVSARPIKGSAVFWFNLLKNGEIDPNTFHGGCPVVLGQKEIANRWIMQYENMFKWPCGLDPEE